MNESFIKISRTCVKSQADPGLELQKALAVPPQLHVLHTAMRAGLQITRLTALKCANFGIPDQRNACAASQGMKV